MGIIIPHVMVTFGLGVFALCCIAMGAFAFSLTFFKYTLPQIESNDFKEANCTVLSHNDIVLDCSHQSSGQRCYYYSTSMNVRVQSGEETWNGIAKKRKAHAFDSQFKAQEWLNDHPLNTTDTCYYDPKDRSDIVYENKGLTNDTIVRIIIVSIWAGIAFLVGGIVISILLSYYGLLCCRVIRWEDEEASCHCWCFGKTFEKKEKSSGQVFGSPLYDAAVW